MGLILFHNKVNCWVAAGAPDGATAGAAARVATGADAEANAGHVWVLPILFHNKKPN